MKSHTEYLWMNTPKRREFVNITDTCEEIVDKSGIQEGMMLVSAMHITAAVWVNDNEGGILQDAMDLLEKLAPFGPDYRHHRTGEDNGDAHLKNLLTHHQVIIPINGRQDGPRPLADHLLRRVRWSETEAGCGEGDRGVAGNLLAGWHI